MGQRVEAGSTLREYTLSMNGGECDVRFSPADGFFAERLFNVFDALSAKQDEHEKQATSAIGKREIFEVARARDAEMRQMLNGVFGRDVCAHLLRYKDELGEYDISCYALSDGLPQWCNLLLAVLDLMDESLVKEQKASNPRVQKYTAKYAKYQK